ncbi:hypothetical protein Cantr_01163 [Candida viswanathii]|uniref:Uncharacterized protein n=1 Tax=Candida viswanathii TaxID=5486 RepID=A0A367YIU3_9ASCO|nr:hypothetical protein Cantr_01163 [Candida viswanathii]
MNFIPSAVSLTIEGDLAAGVLFICVISHKPRTFDFVLCSKAQLLYVNSPPFQLPGNPLKQLSTWQLLPFLDDGEDNKEESENVGEVGRILG